MLRLRRGVFVGMSPVQMGGLVEMSPSKSGLHWDVTFEIGLRWDVAIGLCWNVAIVLLVDRGDVE
jgi:hypothetical protein